MLINCFLSPSTHFVFTRGGFIFGTPQPSAWWQARQVPWYIAFPRVIEAATPPEAAGAAAFGFATGFFCAPGFCCVTGFFCWTGFFCCGIKLKQANTIAIVKA